MIHYIPFSVIRFYDTCAWHYVDGNGERSDPFPSRREAVKAAASKRKESVTLQRPLVITVKL